MRASVWGLLLMVGCDAGAPAPPAPVCPAEPMVVATDSGCVRGVQAGAVESYLGIPFAAPPVAELRFRAPEPPAKWLEVRDTSAFGKACPQINPLLTGQVLPWDEDCLTLNVWTPSSAAGSRPVMVFIHGGGLQNGASSQGVYAGHHLAERGDVVVVTLNYRLGQLGYLAHADGIVGNFGLSDQLAALRWVKANAKAFGGDPERVTIFGESAGGISVCAIMASPLSAGLFHRAAIQSAACPSTTGGFTRTKADAEAQGARVAQALGCADAACLRAQPAEAILRALPALQGLLGTGERYGLTLDGTVLNDSPAAVIDAGQHQIVPALIGTTADEATVFTQGTMVRTADEYEAWVRAFFKAAAPGVLTHYPASAFPTGRAALNELVTDFAFACPSRARVRSLARTSAPAWLYQFTYANASAQSRGLGAFHGSELEYVFGTVRDRATATDGEKAISDAVLGYWSRFAASGDPNGAGASAWPTYTLTDDNHLGIDLTITVGTALKRTRCDFLDTLL